MCVWLDFDYFQVQLTLLQHMSTLGFNFFLLVYFNTNNFKNFSCLMHPHVTAMLKLKFFFCQAMCWPLTLTLIHIGMNECGMSLDMLGWTLAFLIQIYFISFGFILLLRWKQVFKRAHLLALRLAKACSFTTTCWYPPACFGNSIMILPWEFIDCLCMEQVSGQAIAYVPCILSWCSHRVIIH